MENMHIDMGYKKGLTEACKVKACRTNDIFFCWSALYAAFSLVSANLKNTKQLIPVSSPPPPPKPADEVTNAKAPWYLHDLPEYGTPVFHQTS